jgi:hypothetical protein
MSSTTDFIAELVRAGNDVDKLQPKEIRRLLDRAATTIQDLREQIHRWPSPNVRDAVSGLEGAAVAAGSGNSADEDAKAALLDAATMIRDLHVRLGAKPSQSGLEED